MKKNMPKKILGAAISAVMATAIMTPTVAIADAQLYGRIYVEIAEEDKANTTVDDNQGTGRIGLRFSEKLSKNLSAVGKFEFGTIDAADGDGIGSARDQYVGLRHKQIGQISAGSFHGAYKKHGGVTFDPFNATGLQARINGGMSQGTFGTNSFFRNAVEYKSPDWGGFRFTAQYSADDQGSGKGADGDYMIGAKFKIGFIELIAAGNHEDTADDENWKLGAKLKLGSFGMTFQYENVEIAESGFGGQEGEFWFGSIQYKLGSLLLVANLATFEADNSSGVDVDTEYYALGGRYFFSKRTSLYGGYRETDADTSALSDDAVVLGLRHDF